MSISFNSIPLDIRTPYQAIEIDNSRAVVGLSIQQHKILLIGQRLAAGAVAEGVPKQILGAAQAEGYFGRGAQLTAMCAAAKKVNNTTEMWAIALDDAGAAAAATGKITTANGAATATGTLHLYVQGIYVPIAVTNGDNQDTITTAIIAAINANTTLHVTAVVNGVNANECDLTARNKGESGNDIDVRINYFNTQASPAGVTVSVTAMSGGTTNPDITTAITAIGDEQYQTIVTAWTDATNLAALEAELLTRWGPLVQKEGHAFAAADGSHATLTTLGNGRNSQFLTIMGCQLSPTNPSEVAAIVGAIDAFETDPARPRQTLNMPGVLAPIETDRLTRSERDLHLHDGISTFTVDNGGNVAIERLITTHQTTNSVPDVSYLDVTTMRTLAFIRFSLRARIALKFPRFKLASDTEPERPGQPIVRPKDIRVELIALFIQWRDIGIVEGIEQFKTDLVVERNGSDVNRVDVQLSPDLINQFRVFAAQIQYIL